MSLRVLRHAWSLARQPRDLWLLLRIAIFLRTAPARLERQGLAAMLRVMEGRPRPLCTDPAAGVRRIARLRNFVLRQPGFHSRDTCYLRALTLFRFLDAGGRDLRFQLAVEPGEADGRQHGHAWITVSGESFEPPEAVQHGRTTHLFAYPPLATS